jgi:hypothetical protein
VGTVAVLVTTVMTVAAARPSDKRRAMLSSRTTFAWTLDRATINATKKWREPTIFLFLLGLADEFDIG